MTLTHAGRHACTRADPTHLRFNISDKIVYLVLCLTDAQAEDPCQLWRKQPSNIIYIALQIYEQKNINQPYYLSNVVHTEIIKWEVY